MAVAQDQRAPRTDVVEVAVAVDVDQKRTFTPCDKDGLAADGAKCAGRAVHAAGDQAAGPCEGVVAMSAVHRLRYFLSAGCFFRSAASLTSDSIRFGSVLSLSP